MSTTLEKISEDVHVYKEFLTKEECEKTLSLLLEYSERFPDYWKGISFYESYSAGYPADGDPIFAKYELPNNWFSILIERFKEAASIVAGEDKSKMSRISFHVQRWLPGAYAPLHSDNSNNEGVMGAFTRSRYAGFMYLNDNFEGGLLKMQVNHGEKQLNLKPETGMFAIFHVQRWLPGAYAPLHSDNSNNEGVMGAFTRSRYAGFMYLNDNFEGGLLKMQVNHGEKQLNLKPETGMFAIFHGGHKNMHEVSIIKHGTRYTLGSFWDDREESDYPEDLREAWAKELAEVRAMQRGQNEEWAEIRKEGKRLSPTGIIYSAQEVE